MAMAGPWDTPEVQVSLWLTAQVAPPSALFL